MPTNFATRIQQALADPELRANFRGAMDFLRHKRETAFSDNTEWETLKKQGAEIRQDAVARLPELLIQLEQQCLYNGIQVHWAENGEEANTIVLDIAHRHQAKRVIKGKSMASEEIELNSFLERHNIECIESDMGEYIVQLDNEKPSHIIMPAIHKNTAQITELFERKLGITTPEGDVDALIGVGRSILREKFEQADIGISGVNFAIADTGTLCLVENEGNGRLSTTAPPVHIALMGIEKVIPSIKALPTLQKLLTRSATGQHITSYLNLISSPRQLGELDGPKEVHLVLLDNGRAKISQDQQLQSTLSCIRCGACMNHCPVYTRIGGHAYGSTYPGPIGQILTPQLKGLKQEGELLDACSLNGACGEACPVEIDLPELIRTLRHRRQESHHKKRSVEAFIWLIWLQIHQRPYLYRIATKLATSFRAFKLKIPTSWTKTRTLPKPAKLSLHQQMNQRKKTKSEEGK
jgi:L-lactate dehydrogenase complex protein LldF